MSEMWDFIKTFLAPYITAANITSWIRAGLAAIGGAGFFGSADTVTQVAGALAVIVVAIWSYFVHAPSTPAAPPAPPAV